MNNNFGAYLVVNQSGIKEFGPYKESDSSFECPVNQVMMGRMHSGDENGNTFYKSAPLMLDPSQGGTVDIKVQGHKWVGPFKESNSDYLAPDGWVITGRKHQGDENGDTWYQIAQVFGNDTPTSTKDQVISGTMKESAGTWYTTPVIGTLQEVITGRQHTGDENGTTTYYSRFVFFRES